MVNFQLRLFNFPAERLFKPRKRLAPNLVPKIIVDLLPFSEEDLNSISEDSDLIQFIEYFAFDLGLNNTQDFREYVSTNEFYLFLKTNLPEHEILLGNALKYLFVTKRILQGLVADDTIFSFHLPYLAEAAFDQECSITLIEAGYFKQSLQTLRNVIEVTLLHAYFAIKDYDYDDLLEAEDNRIPSIKNLIIFLRSEALFDGDLERQIFELYKLLSGAVHSQIKKLNTGRTTTDYVTFKEWYDLFIKAANIHLKLVIRMIEIGI